MTKAEFIAELQTDIPDDADVRSACAMYMLGENGNTWIRTDGKTIDSLFMMSRMIRTVATAVNYPISIIGRLTTRMAKARIDGNETMIDMGALTRWMIKELPDDDEQ